MVVEVYAAGGYHSGTEYGQQREQDALRKRDWRMSGRMMRGMSEEEKEGKGQREKDGKLGMRGRHTVALAIHLCDISTSSQSASSHGVAQ